MNFPEAMRRYFAEMERNLYAAELACHKICGKDCDHCDFHRAWSDTGGKKVCIVPDLREILGEHRPPGAYKGLDPKSVIIDLEYDGYTEHDPHSARPMSFVTDDPADPGFWLGTFKAANAGEQYSRVGKHKVRISAAPRQAPLTQMNVTSQNPG